MYNVTHWGWFGREQTELDPADGITPEVEHAFSNGQCHALALAIHGRTGWQLVALDWIDLDPDDYNGYDRAPGHVAVQHPHTGDVLDVRGWGACARWNGGTFDVEPVESQYVTDDLLRIGYLHPDLDAANAYADLVLREYAPDALAA